MKNPRATALDCLLKIDSGANSSQVLDRALRNLPEKERGFVTELVMGVLRWRGRLDYAITYLSDKRVEKIEPEVKNALRMGLYQIEKMRVPPYAAVKETVQLIATPWRRSFVNAILRTFLREGVRYPGKEEPLMYLTHTLSTPEWKALRWLEEAGLEEAERLALYFNSPPPVYLRVNAKKTDEEKLIKALQSEGVEATLCGDLPRCLRVKKGNPARSLALKKGMFYIQDKASQVVGYLIRGLAQEVWDPCAAPGGKASHMAELGMEVYASDISLPRLRLTIKNFTRLGLKIRVFVADGKRPPLRKKFPVILLDAPCSSMGIIHRAPEVKWRITPEKLRQMGKLQEELIEALLPYSDRLLYVVCTQEREETMDLLRKFPLKKLPEPILNFHGKNFRIKNEILFTLPLNFNSDAMTYALLTH